MPDYISDDQRDPLILPSAIEEDSRDIGLDYPLRYEVRFPDAIAGLERFIWSAWYSPEQHPISILEGGLARSLFGERKIGIGHHNS